MANVLNLQADAVEVTQEAKKSNDGSLVWCRLSSRPSVFICWG